MLQAAQFKKVFYCFVLTLAQVWLMHLHSTRLMLLQSTNQSSLEIDLGALRLIQSPNQWVDALALNLFTQFYPVKGLMNLYSTLFTLFQLINALMHLHSTFHLILLEFQGSVTHVILDDQETTSLDPHDKLLRWHYQLGHLPFDRIKQLTLKGQLPKHILTSKKPFC